MRTLELHGKKPAGPDEPVDDGRHIALACQVALPARRVPAAERKNASEIRYGIQRNG